MTSNARFTLAFTLGLLAAILTATAITATRSRGGWLTDPVTGCVQKWDRSQLPVPIYLAPAASPWALDLQAAMTVVDPDGRLLRLIGPLPPLVAQPASAIRFDLDADSAPGMTLHGVERTDVRRSQEGICRVWTARVSIPTTVERGPLRTRTIAHELGHALGLAHSDVETSLMYPRATERFEFGLSSEDAVRLEEAYGPELPGP